MEELIREFERSTGKSYYVYSHEENGRPQIIMNACSIDYAKWLERKVLSPEYQAWLSVKPMEETK